MRVNPYYGLMTSLPSRTTAAQAPPPVADMPRQWVPALRLDDTHRTRLRDHLLALDPDDRYLRFGYVATDEQIGRYVDGLDFEEDEVFGVVNRKLVIVAAAHLAYDAAAPRDAPRDGPRDSPRSAEFGISVSARYRRNGIGRRLFEHAQMRARLRGVGILHIHALAENQPMLRLLLSAGAQVERMGSDAEARLRLPEAQPGTHVESWVEAGAAGLDYTAKRLMRVRPASPPEID